MRARVRICSNPDKIAREGFEPPTSGFPMRFTRGNGNPADSLMGPASTPGCSTSLYFLKPCRTYKPNSFKHNFLFILTENQKFSSRYFSEVKNNEKKGTKN